MIKYIDFQGNVTTETWFREHFGAFTIEQNAEAEFRVVRLKAACEHTNFHFRVVDENWQGIPGINVVFGWPDGQQVVVTKVGGWAECPMFRGAWYDLPGPGPHFAHLQANIAERVNGIGFVIGAPQTYTHFEVIVKRVAAPPPPDDQVIQELLEAQVKNLEVAQHIQNALDLLQGE